MKNLVNYLFPFLLLIIIFRFFNIIMFYAIRFWYVSIPLVIYLVYSTLRRREKTKFSKQTGLDPDDEVKLKEKPIIEDEDE